MNDRRRCTTLPKGRRALRRGLEVELDDERPGRVNGESSAPPETLYSRATSIGVARGGRVAGVCRYTRSFAVCFEDIKFRASFTAHEVGVAVLFIFLMMDDG